MTVAKILAVILIAPLIIFLPSCVAGGSGVKVLAKKNFQDNKRVDLKIRYYSYGGANLKKLKTCVIRYETGLSASSKIVAVESLREREMVEWTATGLRVTRASDLRVDVEIFTEVFNRQNTITKWNLSYDNLSCEFQSLKSTSSNRKSN